MEKYFTCDEIAEKYKVKKLTVWDWIRKGRLNAIQTGKAYRIRQQDIDAFDEARKTIV